MNRWRAAAGASIGLAVGWGPFFILSFGLFQKPIITELGWTRAEFSLGFSIATIIAAASSGMVGALVDKFGARRIAFVGTIAFPAVLAPLSLIHTYPEYLACAVMIGALGSWTSYPTYVPILPVWFKRNLGAAFAVASSGVGFGTAVASLCAGFFIVHLGWRAAIAVLPIPLVVVGLANTLALLPARSADQATELLLVTSTDAGLSFHDAIRTGVFWKLTISFALVILVGIGVDFHISALLTDRGFTTLHAAGVASLIGTSILVARLATGLLLDYLPFRILALVIFLGQATAALLLAGGWGGPAPYIAACLIGVAIGGEGDLMPYAFSKQFGAKAYGKIYGFGFSFYNLGTLLGPLLLGAVYGQANSYVPGLAGFAGLSVTAAILAYFSGNAPRDRRFDGG